MCACCKEEVCVKKEVGVLNKTFSCSVISRSQKAGGNNNNNNPTLTSMPAHTLPLISSISCDDSGRKKLNILGAYKYKLHIKQVSVHFFLSRSTHQLATTSEVSIRPPKHG